MLNKFMSFLGTRERDHAVIMERVVDECIQVLNDEHSRLMSKRDVVRQLVSISY